MTTTGVRNVLEILLLVLKRQPDPSTLKLLSLILNSLTKHNSGPKELRKNLITELQNFEGLRNTLRDGNLEETERSFKSTFMPNTALNSQDSKFTTQRSTDNTTLAKENKSSPLVKTNSSDNYDTKELLDYLLTHPHNVNGFEDLNNSYLEILRKLNLKFIRTYSEVLEPLYDDKILKNTDSLDDFPNVNRKLRSVSEKENYDFLRDASKMLLLNLTNQFLQNTGKTRMDDFGYSSYNSGLKGLNSDSSKNTDKNNGSSKNKSILTFSPQTDVN